RVPKLLKNFEDYYLRNPDEQRLIEEEVADVARFREAVGRPNVKQLFEMLLHDPLARFGDLDPIDLQAFFSLTRGIAFTGQPAVSASAATAEESGAASLQQAQAGRDVAAIVGDDVAAAAGDYI